MYLYVNPISPNARRPLIVARMTELPLEIVVVDMGKGEHRQTAFLGINPNHKVPALLDGDLRLWESGAICQYIAAKAGRTDLWPTEPAAQADVSRWMFWNHTHFAPPVAVVNFERAFKKMFGQGEPDEALVAPKLADFAEQAAILDAHLAGKEWVTQGRLTLADIQLGCTLTYAQHARLPIDDHPNLAAWLGRLRALPAWQVTDVPPPA